jgi:hypothetical protein
MPHSTGHKLKATLVCAVLLTAFAAIAAPSAASAEHGGPKAVSVPELVLQLGVNLDELANTFGFEPNTTPGFDDPWFNKLLRKSRLSLEQARRRVDRTQVCEGLFKLARSVSQLEHAANYGAAQNVSGWGFAEDLASLTSFIAESFLEDLVVLAGQEGADEGSLDLAIEAEASGDALRQSEEWTSAMVEFVAGTCALF